MAERKRIDEPTGTETVGHEWDGIEELDTPMPRWWLWTLYATIAWAVVYTVLYPAWPMISSATAGTVGWSSRAQLDAEMKAEANRKRPVELALAQIPIERLPEDSKLLNAAVQGGAAAFKVNCVQCHGSGAAGTKGYPNLNDDDWLWGGDLQSIQTTIAHGIRFDGDGESHVSEMPAFADTLDPTQTKQVAAYVWGLTNKPSDPALAEAGRQLFLDNCAACHGEDGKGKVDMGAPDLADAIWLKSKGEEAIARQIAAPKHGVMPAWASRLGEATVKELTVFVHSLGGGT